MVYWVFKRVQEEEDAAPASQRSVFQRVLLEFLAAPLKANASLVMSQAPSHRAALANAAARCEGRMGSESEDAFAYRNTCRRVASVLLPVGYVFPGVLVTGLVRGCSLLLTFPQAKMTTVVALGLRRNAFRIGCAVSIINAAASVSSGLHEAMLSIPDVLIMSTPTEAGARMQSAYEQVFPASSVLAASKERVSALSSSAVPEDPSLLARVIDTHLRLTLEEVSSGRLR